MTEPKRSTPARRGYEPDCADCPTPAECKAANDCAVMRQIRHPERAAVVCNLAEWFGMPDVGYQPHYGRKKRT